MKDGTCFAGITESQINGMRRARNYGFTELRIYGNGDSRKEALQRIYNQ